ncbi:MAG: biopolymer transporter ExbD [Cytophagales bacterium]|nr:biopolymer transporter ExbD [Armatimonadota bacterium]
MHGTSRDDDDPVVELNLIPLIDISLTLLIILMVTSAFIKKPGMALKLPATQTREGAPETNRDLVVLVAKDGRFFVDSKIQSDETLRIRMTSLATRNKQARVLLKGDRDVPYGRVMRAMDLARLSGLTRVVLPTDPTPPAAAAR